MKNNQMKFMTKNVARIVAPIVLSAALIFGCTKPEPEKNCIGRNGAMEECPYSISMLQKDARCVEKDGKTVRFETIDEKKPSTYKLKENGDKPHDIKMKVEPVTPGGLYEVTFTIPEGTKGYVKAVPCD